MAHLPVLCGHASGGSLSSHTAARGEQQRHTYDSTPHYTPVMLTQVIPMLAGDATDQTPPDLPSFLFKERIVYLVSDLGGPVLLIIRASVC